MLYLEVTLPSTLDFTRAEQTVDAVCQATGLLVTQKSTLAQYPGCCHWHLKQGKTKGTLELTVWPSQRRIWFNVHQNRAAGWIEERLPHIKRALEEALSQQ